MIPDRQKTTMGNTQRFLRGSIKEFIMDIGKTLYVITSTAWRKWLSKHHDKEQEIWLVFYKKNSGKPRLPYNDAAEEALCFGWIDSTVKKIDEQSYAQRFTPRRPNSPVSEMNKERIRRLIEEGKMFEAGLLAAGEIAEEKLVIAGDILKALKADKQTWHNFENFPDSYKKIRIGWIEGARKRPAEFEKRLKYLVMMTSKNKRFGMVQ